MSPLPPGATLGILGGGQLGRMAAMAAARLGYRCHVFAPEPDQPAMEVAADATVAPYEDEAALARFAAVVDAVTLEFENVPVASLAFLERHVTCRPGARALGVCQDRLAEKRFLESVGVAVAPWRPVRDAAELAAAVEAVGLPAVLKTTRSGYDGRGQAVVRSLADASAALERLASKPLILEALVSFRCEVSAIAARGADGALALYDLVENRHAAHILDVSLAPARIGDAEAALARDAVRRVADGLDYVGVLALELFVLADGGVLGNEIAPRPHNSGHWTIEACPASQFEQQIRALAGLELGEAERHHDAIMRNLIGEAGLARWSALTATSTVVPHWYGKRAIRPGRKMGHVTRLLPRGSLAENDLDRLLGAL